MSFRGPEGNSRREPITTAVRVQVAGFADNGDGTYSPTADRSLIDASLTGNGDGTASLDTTVQRPEGISIAAMPSGVILVY